MGFWNRPREVWWRRALFQVHLWSGLVLGLYFVTICLTGSIVVYKKELERLQIPQLVHVEAVGERGSFKEMIALVQERYPGYRLQNAYLYQEPGISWSFRLQAPQGRVQAYVDPYRMTILGQDEYNGMFLQWVYDLHTDLLMGRTGSLLNGWGAFLLTAMCLSGIVVWWPGRRVWRKGVEFATTASWKRQNYDVHKLTGLASFALIALISVTGAYWSFTPQYESALAWMTRGPSKQLAPRVVSVEGAPAADIDVVLAAAMRTIPEGEARLFTFSSRPELPHSLLKMLPDDWRTQGDNAVYIHPQTAEVVGVTYHKDLPLGVRLQRDMFGLHFGTFWGHSTRVVWLLVGLAPIVLYVSGLLMWWNRSLSKIVRRRRARHAIPQALPDNVAAVASTRARDANAMPAPEH
ncbi:MAG: PepSY-associated TM helix domain-containing protein [Vicinamibacterales bacterium]